ncbi:3'-5' exonuclease [Alloscardovia omnicolens]|uniref:3'-5' exonuclease n=1 Tax=Alloscardovia omnicolens TaxID=419015 RepID=UPI000664E047|nr:3'-5' exonuclease [Alloscardovia omnicolens]
MVNYNYFMNLGSGKVKFTISKKYLTDDYKEVDGTRKKCVKSTLPPRKTGKYPRITLTDSRGNLIFDITSNISNAYSALEDVEDGSIFDIHIKKRPLDEYGRIMHEFTLTPPKETKEITNPITRIVVDTETTGLDPEYDELLQISIIDGNGATLHDRYYKPEHTKTWREAERIHHITPKQVANKQFARQDLTILQDIFDRTQEIVIYNAPFDLAFLAVLGLKFDANKITDTMREYGQLFHHTSYYKLTEAAKECNHIYVAHNALSDCKATLAVQKKVDKRRGQHVIEQNDPHNLSRPWGIVHDRSKRPHNDLEVKPNIQPSTPVPPQQKTKDKNKKKIQLFTNHKNTAQETTKEENQRITTKAIQPTKPAKNIDPSSQNKTEKKPINWKRIIFVIYVTFMALLSAFTMLGIITAITTPEARIGAIIFALLTIIGWKQYNKIRSNK